MGQIDKFRAAIGKAKGFARPSKFAVRISPPSLFTSANLANNTYVANGQSVFSENSEFLKAKKAVDEMHKSMRGQIELFCSSIEMPGHDLQTQQQQHGSAPVRDMVTSHAYEGMISASFYLSADLKERHFFEKWQSMAVNKNTHKANYYDDYTGSMEIFQLSNGLDSGLPFPTFIDKLIDVDMAEYGIRASEVYPATISGIEYGYERGNQIATMAVGFNYREWRNLGNRTSKLRPYS
jgi:hypothetical protein